MSESVKLSAIDRALAAAKARKAAKEAAGILDEATQTGAVASAPKAPKAPRTVDPAKADARAAAKAAKFAQLEAERAERRAAREARKAERGAAPSKGPAHMKKVERALSKLPQLNNEAKDQFDMLTSNFGLYELEKFAAHLQLFSRTQKTIRAAQLQKLPLGATVTITGGEPRFVGLQGKVIHSQKLRAKIAVDGVKKPVYIYTGEAKIME